MKSQASTALGQYLPAIPGEADVVIIFEFGPQQVRMMCNLGWKRRSYPYGLHQHVVAANLPPRSSTLE